MKIGKPFKTLQLREYVFYIDHHHKYTDFNTLGLYRSILENDKLDEHQKIELREYANKTFGKSYHFLQLKDPQTYFHLQTIGMKLTVGDEKQLWKDIIAGQQKLLSDKKIKHRNFGVYSKHTCGYDSCHLDGLMIRRGSMMADSFMQFGSDKCSYMEKEKSDRRKSDRKNEQKIIKAILNDE